MQPDVRRAISQGKSKSSIYRDSELDHSVPRSSRRDVAIVGGVAALLLVLFSVLAFAVSPHSKRKPAVEPAVAAPGPAEDSPPPEMPAKRAAPHEYRLSGSSLLFDSPKKVGHWRAFRLHDDIYDEIVALRQGNDCSDLNMPELKLPDDQGGWLLYIRQRGREAPEAFIGNSRLADDAFDKDFPVVYRFDSGEPITEHWSHGSEGSLFCPSPQAFLRHCATAKKVVIRAPTKGMPLDLVYYPGDLEGVLIGR